MHMSLRLFGSRGRAEGVRTDRPRYVSSIQRDVQRYEGWTQERITSDYRANKSVHTIMTLGYMEYAEGVLVLTDKGRMLMRYVGEAPAAVAERSDP